MILNFTKRQKNGLFNTVADLNKHPVACLKYTAPC